MIQKILERAIGEVLDNAISSRNYWCRVTATPRSPTVVVTLAVGRPESLDFMHMLHVDIEQKIRRVDDRLQLSLSILER